MNGFTARPEIRGRFGVTASTHWIASAVGMSMLERGGNAFDAAVAMGFALQVVEPHLNGPGGEVPILLHAAAEGRARVLCGQGTAPAKATIAHYRALGLDLVPGTGLLAAVVPGAFGAWLTLLRDYGTLSLADVLAPAIAYARDGIPLVPRIVEAIAGVRELFLRDWPTSAAVFLPDGRPPATGEPLRNRTLAATYQRIVEDSAAAATREARINAALDLFYRGFVAEAMAGFCADNELLDSSGERHAGLLAGDDLAGWRPSYEEPLAYDYHGYRVLKCGPWSQGPVFLQQLALLKGFDLGAMDPTGPDFVHTVVEAAKLAFADREAYYGDPLFVEVPIDRLLADDYSDARRALIGARASMDLVPGEIPGFSVRLAEAGQRRGTGSAHGTGEPTMARADAPAPGALAGDTCHLDVIDRHGNMVSATPSGGWLQSSPVIPELGFPLSTRAQMFWLEEGLPASLAPGKRPRTTLTPSMALRDGAPYLAFGTPGGDQQDQWTLTFFLRHVHHGMNLQEAIEAPLFHTSHFPGSFYPRTAEPGHVEVEGRFPEATVAELRARGHDVAVADPWGIGRITAAARGPHFLHAAATPRGMQAYAIGR